MRVGKDVRRRRGFVDCTSGGCTISASLDRWNGRRWLQQTIPVPRSAPGVFLSGVSCSSASACTAVGYWDPASCPQYLVVCANPQPLMVRWNGSSWTRQQPPRHAGKIGDSLGGVSCPSARQCIAVGREAERWNGSRWMMQRIPRPGVGCFIGNGPSCLSVSCATARLCVAIGNGNVYRWNGSRWSPQ